MYISDIKSYENVFDIRGVRVDICKINGLVTISIHIDNHCVFLKDCIDIHTMIDDLNSIKEYLSEHKQNENSQKT